MKRGHSIGGVQLQSGQCFVWISRERSKVKAERELFDYVLVNRDKFKDATMEEGLYRRFHLYCDSVVE